jgi:hypothetical protein
VTDMTGVSEFYADGIIGLTPSGQRTGYNIFMEQLYNSDIIKSRVFSFDLESSTISLGGFELPDGYY